MLGKNTILKAIHNWLVILETTVPVWMLGKNTILKAIHNYSLFNRCLMMVWMLGKNTILKAIHNTNEAYDRLKSGVNAG